MTKVEIDDSDEEDDKNLDFYEEDGFIVKDDEVGEEKHSKRWKRRHSKKDNLKLE